MFSSSRRSNLIYFILLLTCAIASCEDASISIPLNRTIKNNNRELYGDFLTVESNSTLQINLTNINKKVYAVVFQVHSHLYNVTLYKNVLLRGSNISGTNIGLHGLVKPAPDTYYILNGNSLDLKLYISVHGYATADPIPGGCNLDLPTPIAPYLRVRHTRDVITIGAAAAQDPNDVKCAKNLATKFYRMYMVERTFDAESYFKSIRQMLTLDQIEENGVVVPQTELKYNRFRRWLSAYPGTGSVYVAVAYNANGTRYAAYVPAVTYACYPQDGCEVIDDVLSQLFCAILLFIGIFVCFFGHRFFKTEMFIVGSFAGIIVTFILLSLWTELERPALLGASVLTGSFFGAIWLLLWWFYGIPVLSVCLPTMHLGFVFSALVYYRFSDFQYFLHDDGNFWTIFVILTLLTSATLSTIAYISNILSCAILGSYATIFAVDHYMGSNLKYIMINTVRRAVVTDFNKVILAPPFQWRDALTSLLWVLLASSGFLYQHYHGRGRPPFPPPPRTIRALHTAPASYGTIENGRRFTIQRDARPASDETRPLLEG